MRMAAASYRQLQLPPVLQNLLIVPHPLLHQVYRGYDPQATRHEALAVQGVTTQRTFLLQYQHNERCNMELTFNWLTVLLATVVGMIIAGIWYSKLFGDAWIRLTSVSKEDSKRAGKTPMVILLLTNFIFATALTASTAVATAFFENRSLWFALFVAFIVWLGFSVSTLVQHNTFEQKPVKLTLINSAYQLAMFVGMAFVIGVMQ